MWWWCWVLGCGGASESLPTAPVRDGTFEITLSVPGELEAVEETLLLAPRFQGRLEIAWMAEQGTRVEQGDRLVVFDRDELLKKLDVARTELELARTKIEQGRTKLSLAVDEKEADIERATLDLRLAGMRRTDSDTVPLVEREEARISETKAKMAIDAAQGALASVELEARAEAQLLQLEVARREREVVELEEQIDKTVITAPTAGVVLLEEKWDGVWTVGSRPWASAELISLPDLAAMKVAAKVHEVDAPRVAVGQAARVELDAYPGQLLEGEVVSVADLAVPQGDDEIKYLDIEVALTGENHDLLPGMSARVELVLDTVDEVAWVPIEAVFRDDADEAWVFTESLTGWSRAEVATGVHNDTHIVVEGIEPATRVALIDPTAAEERPAAVRPGDGAEPE